MHFSWPYSNREIGSSDCRPAVVFGWHQIDRCRDSKLSGWCPALLALTLVLTGCSRRPESEVVVYAELDREFAKPILAAFERAHEGHTTVTAEFESQPSQAGGVVDRILAQPDAPNGDVYWDHEILSTLRLQQLGLLESRRWQVGPNHPDDLIASDGTWCGFAARARVLLVNTERIDDPTAYPQSVRELIDPRWQHNCAVASPVSGTAAVHFAVLRERNGTDPTLQLLAQIRDHAVILPDERQVAVAVSTGRVAWGLTDSDEAVTERDDGMPVAIVFPDQQPDQPGTLRIPNTVAVLRRAPHPVAAAALADFLVSPQIEDRLAMGSSSQLPISRASKFPPRVLPVTPVRWMRADFEAAAADWQPWITAVQASLD